MTDTANLIATLDGTSIEYEEDAELPKPDHVIYLDKSARPVSWFVNVFWDTFAKNERPDHSYLNIDRQPWLRRSGVMLDANGYVTDPDGSQHRSTPRDFKIENIPEEDFARIRALYVEGGIEEENAEKVMNTPSKLDGKNILIVDEVQRSGATLDIAKQLVARAFPEATSVRGAYFWKSGTKVSPDGEESQMLSAPVWYDSDKAEGRGIGDLEPMFYERRFEKWQNPRARAQKFGALVLSSTRNLEIEPGNRSRELMREIKQLKTDFEDGKILMRFPDNYDADRMEAYVEALGLRLAPASDKSPDTYANVAQMIDSRVPE